MHGLFSNHAHYPGDYVAVYVVREYEEKHWQPSMEISARAFLPPEDIARNYPDSMKRRLDELVGGAVPAGIW